MPHSSKKDLENLSDTWKARFTLIEKAGGAKLPKLLELSFVDRYKLIFNLPAAFFGPLYYLCKGMYKKALSYFIAVIIAVIIISVVFELAGLGFLSNSLGFIAVYFFEMRANIDYYKKVVLDDNNWW